MWRGGGDSNGGEYQASHEHGSVAFEVVPPPEAGRRRLRADIREHRQAPARMRRPACTRAERDAIATSERTAGNQVTFHSIPARVSVRASSSRRSSASSRQAGGGGGLLKAAATFPHSWKPPPPPPCFTPPSPLQEDTSGEHTRTLQGEMCNVLKCICQIRQVHSGLRQKKRLRGQVSLFIMKSKEWHMPSTNHICKKVQFTQMKLTRLETWTWHVNARGVFYGMIHPKSS